MVLESVILDEVMNQHIGTMLGGRRRDANLCGRIFRYLSLRIMYGT